MPSVDQKVEIHGLELFVSAEFEDAADGEIELQTQVFNEKKAVLRIAFHGSGEVQLKSLRVTTSVSTANSHGIYFGGDPHLEMGYLPHGKLIKRVAAHCGVPLISLINRVGTNICSLGFLGQQLETEMIAQLSEIDARYHISFARPIPVLVDGTPTQLSLNSGHVEEFLVDLEQQSWQEVARSYGKLALASSKIDPLPVNPEAFEPVFCTWTAIHHDLSEVWCIETASIAFDLGFRTWITDDGWHHSGGEFGNYDDVGGWEPTASKFSDFAAHVKSIQNLGMKYLLWVAPFMLGTDNTDLDRTGLMLQPGHQGANFEMLDPLQSGVAIHVANLLERLMADYKLDGFKIDFIDSVSAQKFLQSSASSGQAMMDALELALRPLVEENPNLLIEFRNSYANLAMQSFGNLYRSSDLPVNFFLNRWQATMLRILNPGRAVVTDPMLWPMDESVENVAVHLINGLSAVPMVSIDLMKYPAEHLSVIRHWIEFYRSRKKTLAFGDFSPSLRGSKIPQTSFCQPTHEVIALYDQVPVAIRGEAWTEILNASEANRVLLLEPTASEWRYSKFGPMGELVGEGRLPAGIRDLEIPVGGRIELNESR